MVEKEEVINMFENTTITKNDKFVEDDFVKNKEAIVVVHDLVREVVVIPDSSAATKIIIPYEQVKMNNCHDNVAIAQTIAVLARKKILNLLQKNLYDNLSETKLYTTSVKDKMMQTFSS